MSFTKIVKEFGRLRLKGTNNSKICCVWNSKNSNKEKKFL